MESNIQKSSSEEPLIKIITKKSKTRDSNNLIIKRKYFDELDELDITSKESPL